MNALKLILAASMCGSLNAYTVAITNVVFADETAVPILLPDSTPVPYGEGSIAIGYFNSLGVADLQVVDYDLLLGDFVQFDGPDSEAPIRAFVGVPGFADVSISDPIPKGSDSNFTDENIFVLIGNESSLEESNSFALYHSGIMFGEDNQLGLGGTEVYITDPVDGLVRGSIVGPIDLDLGVVFPSAIQLEKVPEPSSTILLAFSLAIPVCFRRSRTR